MAILTFPTTQSLLGQAPRVPLRPVEPAVQPAAAAPSTTAEETPEQKAAKRYQAAFRNAMLNPNMPIERQFSTGSAKADVDILRRAQLATAWSNGQAAIQERRALQQMQAGLSPTSGVQPVGGTRVAFRNGVPVGVAQDTGVAPQRVQGQVGPSVLSPEQEQANRLRIAELAQQATARDVAARALMGARPAQAVAPAASAALPITVARPAVEPVVPSPVAVQPTFTEALPDDTPAAASVRARQTGLLAPTMVPTPATPAPGSIEARLQEIEAGPSEEQAQDIASKASILGNLRQNAQKLQRLIEAGQVESDVGSSGRTITRRANRDELKRAAAQYRAILTRINDLSEELGESNP